MSVNRISALSTYKRKIILLFFTLSLVAVFVMVRGSYAELGRRVIVRNDAVPLAVDLEKGRFGSGKLYFDDPIDLAVDEDDNLYILDAGNYRIQIVSDKGRYLTEWGSRGDEDGFFDEPVALAINPESDFIIVIDQGTYRAHKFDLKGTHLLSFGKEGTRKGMFEETVDVTIDGLDYIYVLDRTRRMVIKFHKNGTFITEWGDRGRPDERLENPISLAYSDELTGYIYVLDSGKGALLKYDRDGDLDEIIELPEALLKEGLKPRKIEVSGKEQVFILDGLRGKLIRLNADETNVFQLTSDDMVIGEPSGLAIDGNDRVYVTDLKKNRLLRFPLELD